MDKEKAKQILDSVRENISRVIVGKDEVVTLLLTSLISSGHVLLEDLPGTGKTCLAKSLARSLDISFSRIQFTPDLLPSDITGLNYFSQKEGEFIFRKGPVFTSVLLADEINRATPRTQSALLESMEERQVTIDGVTRELPSPFFVIATQNPLETSGTYALPEAQLDRFFMMLSMGMNSKENEERILNRFLLDNPLEKLSPVCSHLDIVSLIEEAKRVYVHPQIISYIASIVAKTREGDGMCGVSSRGGLDLLKGTRSYALINGRDYVIPEDVKKLAKVILSHRIILGYGVCDRESGEKRIEKVLSLVDPPVEKWEKE